MDNYTLYTGDKSFKINASEVTDMDYIPIEENSFHVLKNKKSYKVRLIETDLNTKTIKLAVNGNQYSIQIEDAFDAIIEKMGMRTSASLKVNTIKAPMPGLIVDIMVTEGQEVQKDDPLLILSAMKMENIILAPNNGKVVSIEIHKEDAVEKGQLLIEME